VARLPVVALLAACALATAGLVGAPQANADPCPSDRVGRGFGGYVQAAGARVPIRMVRPDAQGALSPPDSHRVAGLSTAHAQLDAAEGTSVLTWHRRFGSGCWGSLNGLVDAPMGTVITIDIPGAEPRQFRLSQRATVPRDRIRRAWTRAYGPHRLLLVTCTDFRDGAFQRTVAMLAEPVQADVADPDTSDAAPPSDPLAASARGTTGLPPG
jgi:hypothetical protein